MSKIDELRAVLGRTPKLEIAGRYKLCSGATVRVDGNGSLVEILRGAEASYDCGAFFGSAESLRELRDLIDLLAQAKERGLW